MSAFRYTGLYRVQSRRDPVLSGLEGDWQPRSPLLLSNRKVNAALRRSPLWKGKAEVRLRAARVRRRTGAFRREADALYYRQYFVPAAGTRPMASDILDITKLLDHGKRREPYNRRLLGRDNFSALQSLISDPAVAATNEYYCHEAGHRVGWDVGSKYERGYFRVQNRAAWPLIFVEEFRADLHSFGFALEMLPVDRAVETFAYHLLHRFGLAAHSAQAGVPGAGAVPYLLFCLLCDLGFIRRRGGIRFSSLDRTGIVRLMRACADHAAERLTGIEMNGAEAVDVAINAASYFRSRALDRRRLAAYSALVGHGSRLVRH